MAKIKIITSEQVRQLPGLALVCSYNTSDILSEMSGRIIEAEVGYWIDNMIWNESRYYTLMRSISGNRVNLYVCNTYKEPLATVVFDIRNLTSILTDAHLKPFRKAKRSRDALLANRKDNLLEEEVTKDLSLHYPLSSQE